MTTPQMPQVATINGTINFPGSPAVVAPIPPIPLPPLPMPNQCFLCIRRNQTYGLLATTVYKGTYLCNECVKSLPDELLINEFPPTNL